MKCSCPFFIPFSDVLFFVNQGTDCHQRREDWDMREKSYMGVDLGQGGKGVEFTEGCRSKQQRINKHAGQRLELRKHG